MRFFFLIQINEPFDKFIGNLCQYGHIILNVFRLEQRLLGLGTNSPPLLTFPSHYAAVDCKLFHSFGSVQFDRIESWPLREPSLCSKQPFIIYKSAKYYLVQLLSHL